ncbi:RNA polymerase sigma factor, TIGR02999 family [Catalinimonas alkaloidigena]|uniref:RNA polymerase sigma factor, TIGR02999 family n=1 Tax=Catalinimonas alkaloidigena TaxID=1075417 RepID=A0A1G8ZX18_9BACT|nr:sigma-70 family RNA polymerase sigma factor [Catalinimonas alkaloidigena]SDK19656.1 RNA polymerase sigma factor, TIGR02999 family [Catalinimonas alkaloidigena]
MEQVVASGLVTQLLRQVNEGDRVAYDQLFPVVYQQLKQAAHNARFHVTGSETLQTTALVHEAYLKLVQQEQPGWQSHRHFMGVAAKAMRHILVDYARQKLSNKRGGHVRKFSLQDFDIDISDETSEHILCLEDVLRRLEQADPQRGKLVECRFYIGLTIEETAGVLGLSPATVKRKWTVTRIWLYEEMRRAGL